MAKFPVPDFKSLDDYLEASAPGQPEFAQSVREVSDDILPLFESNKDYRDAGLFARLTQPERIVQFRVDWVDDKGTVQSNTGYRVQFNGAIGPYKGGLRFHPTVNTSILKFLGFEQTFKNSLTGLPMGGGKGGSNFDPKGRSEGEIMRFCTAFMTELHRHIGPDIDIPAGDINVGAREIGYLFGAYRRITGTFAGVLTGKAVSYGGSCMRTEATGFGVIYFLEEMLKANDDSIDDKSVIVSGAGNVATHAALKAARYGAKVLTLSDSAGTLFVKDGMDADMIAELQDIKSKSGGSLGDFKSKGAKWMKGKTPWDIEADIALPCATQNEIDGDAAKTLIKNGVMALVEGANMPCTAEAKAALRKADILYAPGKASNAGGVAVSGLEISQDRGRRFEDAIAIDRDLRIIMREIHEKCVAAGEDKSGVDYVKGANIAGFCKVADAMMAQGVG